jgi:uncharacterized protein (TIGR02452 family)
MSVLTCPAVHGHAIREHVPHRWGEIPQVMRARTRKVLAAAAHGQRRLILGAWGCGAFGLDTEMMADIFAETLAEHGGGVFDEIVFAITDWSDEKCFIAPFLRVFSNGA